ncbi:MAG TPA: hypothetical protein VL127_15220 [Bryobacteraceae bacterium]|nr:hypothetical protein [Bryobacteraceae bacterium]
MVSGAQDFLDHFYDAGVGPDVVLPLWWALGATIPICFLSWWVAYRSDWF